MVSSLNYGFFWVTMIRQRLIIRVPLHHVENWTYGYRATKTVGTPQKRPQRQAELRGCLLAANRCCGEVLGFKVLGFRV